MLASEPLFQTYALIVRSDEDGSGKASTVICVQVCDDRPDRGGAELAQLLQLIPPDKLMIETDGPYLVPRTIKPAKARPRRCAKLTDLGYSYCWQSDSEAELRPVLIVRQPTVRPHEVAFPVDTSWLDTSDASVSIMCRNEPALLPYVLTAVADAMGEDKLVVAARTSATARKFFKLSVEEGS